MVARLLPILVVVRSFAASARGKAGAKANCAALTLFLCCVVCVCVCSTNNIYKGGTAETREQRAAGSVLNPGAFVLLLCSSETACPRHASRPCNAGIQ